VALGQLHDEAYPRGGGEFGQQRWRSDGGTTKLTHGVVASSDSGGCARTAARFGHGVSGRPTFNPHAHVEDDTATGGSQVDEWR
jgi:hypothetical protein